MSADSTPPQKTKKASATQFFLKGLAISLPPILTIVILVWISQGIYDYIINPISTVVQYSIAQFIDQSEATRMLSTMEDLPSLEYCGTDYRITPAQQNRLSKRLENSSGPPLRQSDIDLEQVFVPVGDHRRSVPYVDYALVAKNTPIGEMQTTLTRFYMAVVTHRHFHGLFGISAFAVSISVLILYYMGRLVTSRVGAWGFQKTESLFLAKLPVVSNVYSSVKQVTDFLFSERTIEYNRVIAIEYPRRGIWTLGFVTGDSMLEMTAAAGEPLVSVLIPTSPAPFTGFTMNVPRNEVLDLNITIEQAFQFCISCGVLVPPQQQVTPELLQKELTRRLTAGGPPKAVTRPDAGATEAKPTFGSGQSAETNTGPAPEEEPS